MARSRTARRAPSLRRPHGPALGFGLMAGALVILPLTHAIYPYFVMEALCFAIFACAFNLLIGYAGLLSFGHAMFLGTGGYLGAEAATVWGFPPELALCVGAASAAALGLLVGVLSIRRQGIYFAMTTLALAQMVYFVYLQAPFTHGEDGIQGVPQGRFLHHFDLSDQTTLYFVTVAIFLAAFLFILRVINSPFGEVLKAVRENEIRVVSLGYKVDRYKLVAFALSAALSGLAGALKAIVAQNATLTDVHWPMSGEVILMTLVGGMGTTYGPVVGAFIVVAMQQYLAQFGQWVNIIQGVIFVACVLVFRRGIVGELACWLRR